MDTLIEEANIAVERRYKREAAESGRRQREMVMLEYPYGINGSPPVTTVEEPHKQQNGEEEMSIGNVDATNGEIKIIQPDEISANNQEENRVIQNVSLFLF